MCANAHTGAEMSTRNQRDRQLIEHLVNATRKTPSQIAREAGLATTTLTRVMASDASYGLSVNTLEKLKGAFPGLIGDLGEIADADMPEYVEVEVLPSYAGMGGGGFGEGEPGRALLSRQLIEERLRGRPADFLMIDVRGDSMVEAGYLHGDQILVDRRDRDPTQPGPFALFDGDAYVVKLVERVPLKRGWLRIFSANDRYTPYEVQEGEARLIGRPVWLGREL